MNEKGYTVDTNFISNILSEPYEKELVSILNLYLIYCDIMHLNKNDLIDYIRNYGLTDVDSFLHNNPLFLSWLKVNNNLRHHYLNELLASGVIEEGNYYELYKSQYDTIASSYSSFITPFTEGLGIPASSLVNVNGIIYKMEEDGLITPLAPESTILIQNPYDLRQLYSLLSILTNSNHRLIISYMDWSKDKDVTHKYHQAQACLESFDVDTKDFNDVFQKSTDYINYVVIDVNTLKLKNSTSFFKNVEELWNYIRNNNSSIYNNCDKSIIYQSIINCPEEELNILLDSEKEDIIDKSRSLSDSITPRGKRR